MMNGVGLIKFIDGSYYNGNLQMGMKNGFGQYQFNDGECYTGNWFQDMRDGRSRYEWNNGDVYEGSFKSNKPFQGEFRYNNGREEQVPRT